MNRQFVLRNRAILDGLIAFLNANWEAFARDEKPLGVTIAPYKRSRSLEANAGMWLWLTQISREAWVAGRQFSPETWNEHLKRELLPERNAKGMDKWEWLPSGERVLVMSTKHLNVAEMSEYMERLRAFAATDLGVTLQDLVRV